MPKMTFTGSYPQSIQKVQVQVKDARSVIKNNQTRHVLEGRGVMPNTKSRGVKIPELVARKL